MRHKVEVDVEITPTMLAETFAGMDSTAQAQTLGLIWHEMERRCGGSFKRAMQCSYIREALGREGEEFVDELCTTVKHVGNPAPTAEPTCAINRAETMDEHIITLKLGDRTLRRHISDKDLLLSSVDPVGFLHTAARLASHKFGQDLFAVAITEALDEFCAATESNAISPEKAVAHLVETYLRCPECNGTGEYVHLNNKRSPCSKGCRKP